MGEGSQKLLSGRQREIGLVIRCDDGRILEATPAAEFAYGYTREELLGLTIFDLRTDGNRNLASGQMSVAGKQEVRFETSHRRRDGTPFRVAVVSTPARSGVTRVLVSFIRPLSEPGAEEASPSHSPGAAEMSEPCSTVWTDDLAIGMEVIDEQHKQICQATSRLRAAMKANELWLMPSVLGDIERYASRHIATEEGEMMLHGYPELARHRLAHQKFAVAFREHRVALVGTHRLSAVLDLSDWLTHWVRAHIRELDGEFGRFVKAQDPPAAGGAQRSGTRS
jgi:hemerythrin-like metal-binding protein/PAS domain S-box-containing protein